MKINKIVLDSIEQAIKKNTALVSVIYVNNEVGTISDIKRIADVSKKYGLAIHSDITQAIGKIDLNVHHMNLDYASCSAHKVYGPKGIGAAYLRADQFGIEPITALLHGGEQENGLRAGTLAVHNIVGFGKAAEIAKRDLALNERRIKKLDKMIIEAINNLESLTHGIQDIIKILRAYTLMLVGVFSYGTEKQIKTKCNLI